MRRRLFTGLSAVSLLLCVATIGLWVRSAWRWDHVGRYQSGPGRYRVCAWDSNRGRMSLNWGELLGASQAPGAVRWVRGGGRPRDITVTPWQRWVYEYRSTSNGAATIHYFAVHDAWLVVVTAVLPAWWLLALRRRRRLAAQGRCLACGYDLRATPGRCPECGAPSDAGARACTTSAHWPQNPFSPA
jgi:hypothetical protein